MSQALSRKFGKQRCDFPAGESIDTGFYEERIRDLGTKLRKLEKRIEDITARKTEVTQQLASIQQFIEDRKIEAPKDMLGDMLQLKGFEESMGLWDMMKMKAGEIAVLFKRYKDRYKIFHGRWLSNGPEERNWPDSLPCSYL